MATIAIIGQGNMGRTHAKAWSELGLGEQIRYVCTPRPGASLPHAPDARFVTDLDAVLGDEEVDILSVCTPTASHADVAIRALGAGKSVLLEKPIALAHADALAISEATVHSSGMLMVAQVVRFFQGYRMLREGAQAGRFGTVQSVRASRLSAPPTWASWLDDSSASGGVLVDFAIHDFDQLNLFLGTPIAVTTVTDSSSGYIETTIDYAGGGTGHVTTCAEMPPDFSFTSSLKVEGSLGAEAFRFSQAIEDAPYTSQAEYFLACVEGRVAPELCPTESAILALDVSLAARTSLETGRTVVIP